MNRWLEHVEDNIYYKKNPKFFIELAELCENNPFSYGQMLRAKGKASYVRRHPDYVPPYKHLYDWVCQETQEKLGDPFYLIGTKCYWILHGLTDFPKCQNKNCGKPLTKVNTTYSRDYPGYCSYSCRSNAEQVKAKREQTSLEKYGCKYPQSAQCVIQKTKDTCQSKFGVSSYMATEEFKIRSKKTKLDKYGDENYRDIDKMRATRKRKAQEDPDYLPNIKKKTCKTKLERYGDENFTNRTKAKATRLANHDGVYFTEEMLAKSNATKDAHRAADPDYDKKIQEKTKKTCQEHWGADSFFESDECKDRLLNWVKDHGGETNPFETEFVKDKSKKTMVENHGHEHSMQCDDVKSKFDFKEINAKGYETKIKNGSFYRSKMEDDANDLFVAKFGVDDVVRQYKSEAYPFRCDFYITSLDLYIECNFHWTHAGHWFDPDNPDDIAKLEKWKAKAEEAKKNGEESYTGAIRTWTLRDPLKRLTASNNYLNYLVFWDLSEAVSWLESL